MSPIVKGPARKTFTLGYLGAQLVKSPARRALMCLPVRRSAHPCVRPPVRRVFIFRGAPSAPCSVSSRTATEASGRRAVCSRSEHQGEEASVAFTGWNWTLRACSRSDHQENRPQAWLAGARCPLGIPRTFS